jgi:hypothetical protein
VTGQSGTTTVAPAAAASYQIVGLSPTATRGTPYTFTLVVVDAFGNNVTGYLGTVHFTSSDANASLPAEYTFTTADAGKHTFMLTWGTQGVQSLTATDKAKSSTHGTQGGIAVQ